MAGVYLYWLPLGAGGHFVRLNGRVYEAITAGWQRRPARDLYHSALQFELPEGTFVIEQTRDVLIWGKLPDWPGLLVYTLCSIAIAWLGFVWFQRTRRGFADVL